MKTIFQKTTTSQRNEAFGRWLCAFSVVLFANNSNASQSSINQRSSFNSDQQLNFSIGGSWGINDQSFANASYAYTRTPIQDVEETDTFYQGTLGVGYAIDNLAFDVGFVVSRSPLQSQRSIGGWFGLTYIYVPGSLNLEDYKEHALSALHSQVYEKKEEKAPLFWVRFGYSGNTMKSNLLAFPENSGKETAFNFDIYFPYSDDLLFSFGASFHGYDNSRGFYDRALKNVTGLELQLLASTIQGLPHSTVAIQGTYRLASRDSFIPRYQATETDSNRLWSHTVDLGWRHQFSKNWYITPTYEISVQTARAASAVIFELIYIL